MPSITRRPKILVINGGSSSIKFALYTACHAAQELVVGSITRIGLLDAQFQVRDLNKTTPVSKSITASDYNQAIDVLLNWINQQGYEQLVALVHRIVHAGPDCAEPRLIDSEFIDKLQQLTTIDPEHLPGEMCLIKAFLMRLPMVPQVACFDTAFYHALPRIARLLPIPRRYDRQGIRRYGFHGLSYEFLMNTLRLDGAHNGRVILAHLGNGSSLTAVLDDKPIDTTMAFTPASGIPMSTRSGDLDPGLIGYLARTETMSIDTFNTMINRESGLLGISETSSDMHDLLKNEADDVRAAEAVELFCYSVSKAIGALSVSLNGLDTLVFAGGIGENAATIRQRVCERLGFLGVELNSDYNQLNKRIISAKTSRVIVQVIQTNEAQVMAKQAYQTLLDGGKL